MQLTNLIVENHGFKRVNRSMYRLDSITLQNGYTSEGNSLFDKIMSTKKAYKVCVDGKYLKMITQESELIELIKYS